MTTTMNVVHAQIVLNPDDPTDYSHIGVEVWTEDGTELTAQAILDAVSDALIDHYPLQDEGDEPTPRYDA